MTDDELRELLALAAVGALSDEEQRTSTPPSTDRPDLRAELDRLLEVATTMADAVAETPPPALRASVLDAIADTPQLAPEPPAPTPVDDPSPRSCRSRGPPAPVGRRRCRRRGRRRSRRRRAHRVAVRRRRPDDQVAAVVDADDAVDDPDAR